MNSNNHKQSCIIVFFIIFLTLFGLESCEHNIPVKMNQIQVIGSHNSYKLRIQKELWEILYQQDSATAIALDYEHTTLSDQLDLGLRGLELDVFYDPEGGRYTTPLGQQLIKEQEGDPIPFDTENKMALPGLKVFHIQDIDFRSQCLLFKEGLEQLKQWSLLHSDHLPIIITINAKDQKLDFPGFTTPLIFDAGAIESIDEEIRSVFNESQLITPDFVRGDAVTLEKSILSAGWPSIEKSRGKFMFVLDEGGEKKESYLKDHPSLRNRVMFTISAPGNPESAFLIMNDPVRDHEKIKELVKSGYMVRTRADEGTREARSEDYTRWETALESGAQIISTDYYKKDAVLGTEYQIKFKEEGNYRLIPFLKNY